MPHFLEIVGNPIFVGGLIAWIWLVVRAWRGRPILPYEPRRPVPWGGIDLAVVVAAMIFLQGLCLGLAVKWSGIELPNNWNDLDSNARFVVLSGNLVANALTLVVAVLILFWQTAAEWSDLGINLRWATYDLRCGAIAFVAAAPVVFGLQWLITQWVPYQHQLLSAVQEKSDVAMLIVAAVSAIAIAPLFEEFFFRVLLQGWLEKLEMRLVSEQAADDGAAESTSEHVVAPVDNAEVPLGLFGLSLGMLPIVVSSTLFALMHWGQGAAPIPLFVLALVLGFLYQRTHRILPSLTVHVLLNSVSLAVFFFGPKA